MRVFKQTAGEFQIPNFCLVNMIFLEDQFWSTIKYALGCTGTPVSSPTVTWMLSQTRRIRMRWEWWWGLRMAWIVRKSLLSQLFSLQICPMLSDNQLMPCYIDYRISQFMWFTRSHYLIIPYVRTGSVQANRVVDINGRYMGSVCVQIKSPCSSVRINEGS